MLSLCMLFLILGVGYFLVGKKSRKDLMNKIQQNQLAVLGGFILAYFLFVRNNVEGYGSGECTMTPGRIEEVVRDLHAHLVMDQGFEDNYPDINDWKWIAINHITSSAYYRNKQVKKWNEDAISQEDLRIKHGAPEPPEVFDDE